MNNNNINFTGFSGISCRAGCPDPRLRHVQHCALQRGRACGVAFGLDTQHYEIPENPVKFILLLLFNFVFVSTHFCFVIIIIIIIIIIISLDQRLVSLTD